jgi:hypothetical protein
MLQQVIVDGHQGGAIFAGFTAWQDQQGRRISTRCLELCCHSLQVLRGPRYAPDQLSQAAQDM